MCVKVIYLCPKRQSLNNILKLILQYQFIHASMSTQSYKFYYTLNIYNALRKINVVDTGTSYNHRTE